MKNKLAFFLLPIFLLSSCASPKDKEEPITLYKDFQSHETNDFIVTFSEREFSYAMYPNDLYFDLIVQNKTSHSCEYAIVTKGLKSDEVHYFEVSGVGDGSTSKAQLEYYAHINEGKNENDISFSFKINDVDFVYLNMEKPDELRVDRNVKFYIGDKLVSTVIVKDRRPLADGYLYESSDHLYFSNEWFSDKELTKHVFFGNRFLISEDMKIFGKQEGYIIHETRGYDEKIYVMGVRRIPSDKILRVPSFDGEEIYFTSYFLESALRTDYELEALYIPKNIKCIYGYNRGIVNAFSTKIYYEGSMEEWKSLFYFENDIITYNVICNTSFEDRVN